VFGIQYPFSLDTYRYWLFQYFFPSSKMKRRWL